MRQPPFYQTITLIHRIGLHQIVSLQESFMPQRQSLQKLLYYDNSSCHQRAVIFDASYFYLVKYLLKSLCRQPKPRKLN